MTIKFSRTPDAEWTERDEHLARFRVESGKVLREMLRLEMAARERVLRELVVGPAVPIATVETDDGDPLAFPRPWGVLLDGGSVAWFQNNQFLGWDNHKPR